VEEIDPGGRPFVLSEPNFLDLRAGSGSFESMAGIEAREVTIGGEERPLRVQAARASAELFPMLAVEPLAGRTFTSDEDRPDGGSVVVVSEGLLRRLGRPLEDVLGSALRVDGAPLTVVGVLRGSFDFPPRTELWVPLQANPLGDRGDRWLLAIGRLRPDRSLAEARTELRAVAAGLAAAHPDSNVGWSADVGSLRDALLGESLPSRLWTLGLASTVLLFIAASNAAGLMLVHALGRRGELSVRAALGAGRFRAARELLVEGALLSALASVLGLALAAAALPLVRALRLPGVPGLERAELDATATALIALTFLAVCGMVALVPALRATRGDLLASLRTAGRRGAPRSRVQRGLVLLQVALATMLLVAGGALLRGLVAAQGHDPGFDTRHVVAVPFSLDRQGLTGEDASARVREIEERVAALPGVETAGVTSVRPFSGFDTVIYLAVEGRSASGPEDAQMASWRTVSPGFFDSLGLRPSSGRLLRRSDAEPEASAVVVLSSSLAAALFPDGEVVGSRVAFGWDGSNWREVVGVVGDLRDVPLEAERRPLLYLPYAGWRNVSLLVRTEAPVSALAAPLRSAIWEVDPEVALPSVLTVRDALLDSLLVPRLQTSLVAALAGSALLLAGMGLFGVVAFSASRRTREVGIRMAVGATPRDAVGLFLVEGMALASAGTAAGMLAAAVLASALASRLPYVVAVEPATAAAVALLMLAVAALASVVPARRASRLDPLHALRLE
jgi:predicted permease